MPTILAAHRRNRPRSKTRKFRCTDTFWLGRDVAVLMALCTVLGLTAGVLLVAALL